MSDYYQQLGVGRDATQEEIKRAFRKKAAVMHPDRNKSPNAHEEFKQLNEAYQVLSDPQKKQYYDQLGHDNFKRSASQGGFESRGSSAGGFEFDFSDLFSQGGFGNMFDDESIFGDIFGSRQRGGGRKGANRGEDLFINLDIELIDVLNGNEKEINYKRKEKCQACGGTGGSNVVTCRTCNGQGRVSQVTRTILGTMQVMRECPTCNGTGKEIKEKCKKCNGETLTTENHKLKIRIPQGIETGVNLRFQGEGNSGKFGNPYGDLYVQITVKQDLRFKRKGNDLYFSLDVPFYYLVLGEEITVPTLDGDKLVKIPAGTEIGNKLTLRELGLPDFRTKKRGNIYIDLNVKLPTKLSSEERDLFLKIKAIEEGKSKKSWW